MAEKKKRLSRGQKLIQTVVHPQTGETLDVIFDTSTLKFSAGIGQTWFNDTSAQAVIDWAEQTLHDRATLQWIPIIQILVDPEHRLDHNLRGSHEKQRGEWIGNPGLDAHAKRRLDPKKYDIAAAGCAMQFRRVCIAKVEKGWLSLPWHAYSPTIRTEEALRQSAVDHALPREFNGTLPYVDRGAEYHGVKRLYISEEHETRAIIAYDEATWMTLAQMADILDKARQTIGELIGEPEKLAAFATEKFLALGK